MESGMFWLALMKSWLNCAASHVVLGTARWLVLLVPEFSFGCNQLAMSSVFVPLVISVSRLSGVWLMCALRKRSLSTGCRCVASKPHLSLVVQQACTACMLSAPNVLHSSLFQASSVRFVVSQW